MSIFENFKQIFNFGLNPNAHPADWPRPSNSNPGLLVMPQSHRLTDIFTMDKLEDLTVLKLSPDPFNNVKITAYNETYFVLWGLQPFWSSDLKRSNEYSIKQPSDF